MKRVILFAAFVAVFSFLFAPVHGAPYDTAYNVYATSPATDIATLVPAIAPHQNVPLIRQIPPMFLTTASGTGTATRFLEPVPLVWDPITKEIYASGSPLVFRTNSVITIGTMTVSPEQPFTVYQTTAGTATAGSTLVSALASRRFVTVFNLGTETVWINPGGSTATVSSGIPVYTGQYFHDTLDAAVPLPYIASTSTAVSITQGR